MGESISFGIAFSSQHRFWGCEQFSAKPVKPATGGSQTRRRKAPEA
jgi:hypothetical protein